MIYISEAVLNLKENIRYALVLILFLSISFLGIIITDSLIYSVSMQAEKELKSNGDNIVSVDLYTSKPMSQIANILNNFHARLSFSQHSFFSGGDSPYSDSSISVIATDKTGINLLMNHEFNTSLFEGDIAIYNDEIKSLNKKSVIYFNGVPFNIIGGIKKSKTEFLDSLGLSNNKSNGLYYIPLETLFRFNLDNKIDNVKIIFKKNVTPGIVASIRRELNKYHVENYTITTSLDARKIVDRVLNRFALLTNSIYFLLTLTAIISCITLCKRNFQSRSTEFALKIIHGIPYKSIQIIIIIESIFTVFVSLLLSISISMLTIVLLSKILMISVKVRWMMIFISLSTVLLTCFIANFFYGKRVFTANPIDLVKARAR